MYFKELGSFGALNWDTIFASAGFNTRDMTWDHRRDWQRTLLIQLLRYKAVTELDDVAWTNAIPTMSCSDMTRSLGLGYDVGAICARLGPVWPEVQQYVRDSIAEAEAEKWAEASCVDRAPADGGGSVCTAADDAVQVRCWSDVIGDFIILPSGARCPAGSGGVPAGSGGAVMVRQQKTMVRAALPTTGLRGRVVDGTGRGIAGALVTMSPSGGMMTLAAIKRSTSDASGNFSVKAPTGTYDVTVSATGYTDVKASGVVVGTVGMSDGGLVTMPPVVDAAAAAAAEEAARMAQEAADAAAAAEAERLATLTKTEAEEPWYKSPWVWVIGGVVVIGGGYLIWQASQKKE